MKQKQQVPIGREFRPWAIWIWNLTISKEEVIKQLNFFIEQDFGGVAVKIGRDMRPAFLSEEFFELLLLVLQTAQKKNIGIRLAEDFSLPWSGSFNCIGTWSQTIAGTMPFFRTFGNNTKQGIVRKNHP